MSTDLRAIAAEATARFGGRSHTEKWSACAALWARLWVLAGTGWQRWPNAAQGVFDALRLALLQAGGVADSSSRELVLLGLEALEIDDDDGSSEWQYVVDLAAVLAQALGEASLDETVEVTIQTFLEGVFNVLANEVARELGRPISHVEALEAVGRTDAWKSCVQLVKSL